MPLATLDDRLAALENGTVDAVLSSEPPVWATARARLGGAALCACREQPRGAGGLATGTAALRTGAKLCAAPQRAPAAAAACPACHCPPWQAFR